MRAFWMFAIAVPALAGASPHAPTFSKDVAPILFKSCANCHHAGAVGPFSLTTYEDAARRAKLIAAVTANHSMPPWKPEPGFGDFKDSRRLSDSEVAILRKWALGGAPAGRPADMPAAPVFHDDWQLGTPDLVMKMAAPYAVSPDGPDQYRCFVLPLNLAEDRPVDAVEFRPGNAKVVHHSLFFIDSGNKGRGKAHGGSYPCFGGPGFLPTGGMLDAWVPGAASRRFPEGVGKIVPKGADLVIQNHYHPDGKPESDQSTLAIYFAKTPPARTAAGFVLRSRSIDIPAGEKRYEVKADFTTPIDLTVYGIAPHMHLLGREMKVTATLPDGSVKPMIWIRDWDFNWQGKYRYETPLLFPKGTRFDMVAYYDNSAANPRNPNSPPKHVAWGEQTTDEMALCFVLAGVNGPGEQHALVRAMIEQTLQRTLTKAITTGRLRF